MDGISVATSNIQIDPTQVFTLEEVQFAFGKNKGVGRNLRIELARASESSDNPMGSSGFAGVGGINRIELASLKRLRLEPTGDSPAVTHVSSDSVLSGKRDSDLFSNSSAPLEISCAGPFAFDFRTNTATLDDQVYVEQQDANRDRLDCDQLVLKFADKTPGNRSTSQTGLTVETFHATGLPARVVSHSRNTTVSANELSYNVTKGQFQATSNHQVTVETPEFQLLSRELNYMETDDGSMGPVDANGPGRLLRLGTADHEPLLVKWQKRMTLRPDGTKQQVTIDGQSHVHLGHDISLLADQIELWLEQNQKKNRTPSLATQGQQASESWDPIRVKAAGEVRINTPQLSGTTDRLTATWQGANEIHSLPGNVTPDSNAGAAPFGAKRHIVARVAQEGWTTLSPAQAAGWTTVQPVARVARQPIIQPGNKQSNPVAEQTNDAERKIDFHGDHVVVQLKRVGSETEIADLKIDGRVRVAQTVGSSSDPTTHTIAGSSLHLVPQNDQHQRCLLYTSPSPRDRG